VHRVAPVLHLAHFFSQNADASSSLSNPWNSIRLTCSPNRQSHIWRTSTVGRYLRLAKPAISTTGLEEAGEAKQQFRPPAMALGGNGWF
jgi:hypothetical protein